MLYNEDLYAQRKKGDFSSINMLDPHHSAAGEVDILVE